MQLNKKYITSTYKKELGGLVPDQKLIALGSNGTLLPSVRSVFGMYLANLWYLDATWVKTKMDILFPKNNKRSYPSHAIVLQTEG